MEPTAGGDGFESGELAFVSGDEVCMVYEKGIPLNIPQKVSVVVGLLDHWESSNSHNECCW